MTTNLLKIGDGDDWHFVNGPWFDGDNRGLTMSDDVLFSHGDGLQQYHFAFNKSVCCADVRMRFEFKLAVHSEAGVIFRASDESHFYVLHFPDCGQASRSQHFWAALSKMDDSGHLKIVKLEMIQRVQSTPSVWLTADVTVVGNTISVAIGDHGRFEVQDDTYGASGNVGVFLFRSAEIRNVSVESDSVKASSWDAGVRQPKNWTHPCPRPAPTWQKPQDLLLFDDGELLLNFGEQDKPFESETIPLMSRSADGGMTWSEPETASTLVSDDQFQLGRMHLTPGGRLIALLGSDNDFSIVESHDRARTWGDPVPTEIGPTPYRLKRLHVGPQAFVNCADGSMLLFGYGGYDLKHEDVTIYSWGSCHCQSYVCRSTDDGRTWSEPVNLDNPGCDNDGNQYTGNLDLTEACGAQTGDGRIVVLIRPVHSPWMWETWSSDGGQTWGPCVRGPFGGYATPNMLRTSSGALLVAHRLPGLTMHCSRDDGHTWDQGTTIDGALWAMGAMVEVEPDVVLYVYYDAQESCMRAQRFSVTADCLVPIRD
jgi:hypothetical protein